MKKYITNYVLIALIILIIVESVRIIIDYDISDYKNIVGFASAIFSALITSIFVKYHENRSPKKKKRNKEND